MAARSGDLPPPPLEDECANWLTSIPGEHAPDSPLGIALRRHGFTDLESMDFSEQDLLEYAGAGVPVGQLRRFRREAVSMRAARNLGEMTRPQDAAAPGSAEDRGGRDAALGGQESLPARPARPVIQDLPKATGSKEDAGFGGVGSIKAFNGFI